jgi:hypothetical protein
MKVPMLSPESYAIFIKEDHDKMQETIKKYLSMSERKSGYETTISIYKIADDRAILTFREDTNIVSKFTKNGTPDIITIRTEATMAGNGDLKNYEVNKEYLFSLRAFPKILKLPSFCKELYIRSVNKSSSRIFMLNYNSPLSLANAGEPPT